MEEIQISLIDCIGSITQQTIAMHGDTYVYLMTKENVEQSVLDEAVILKNEKDLVLIQKAFTEAIQKYLDTTAQTKGYTDIVSACSYAGYPNSYQTEAIAYGTWRANVWDYAYTQLALVEAGTRAIPTVDEFISELPVIEL